MRAATVSTPAFDRITPSIFAVKTIAFFLTYVLEMLRICNEFRDVVQSRFGAGRNRSRTTHLKRRVAACALTTEASGPARRVSADGQVDSRPRSSASPKIER